VEIDQERKEAKAFLLASSRYGRTTEEGLYEFIIDGKLDFEELKQEVDLPEINFERFVMGYGQENKGGGNGGNETQIECPKCGWKWSEP
jgi:hypothetical protein